MAHPRQPRRGERPSAVGLNAISAFARMVGGLQVTAPLRMLSTSAGRSLSIGYFPGRYVFAKLLGTTSPYSWVEQRWRKATHDWENKPGGRSGTTNAYELNALGSLGGKVVPLYRQGGDWLFRFNRWKTRTTDPPIDCASCFANWPQTELTLDIGGYSILMERPDPLKTLWYLGCQEITTSGWDPSLNYGCGGTTTCAVAVMFALQCAVGHSPGEVWLTIVSGFTGPNPTVLRAPDPLGRPHPCAAFPIPDGIPSCAVQCDDGSIGSPGGCSGGGCAYKVGNCGSFWGGYGPCPQMSVTNGTSDLKLPTGFDCHAGPVSPLTFPPLSAPSWQLIGGTPVLHV